jgi:hypothetical protein
MNQSQALCTEEVLDDAQFMTAHFAAIQAKSIKLLADFHLAVDQAMRDGQRNCIVGCLDYFRSSADQSAPLPRDIRIERMAREMAIREMVKGGEYILKPCRSDEVCARLEGKPISYHVTEHYVISW